MPSTDSPTHAPSDGTSTGQSFQEPSGDSWKLVFDEGFDGSALRQKYWGPRLEGRYYASRWCSGAYSSMVKVTKGSLRATVDEVTGQRARTVQRNAARQLGVSTAKSCPHGVYDNAMVSTQFKYEFRYGIVAARVKFPAEPGQHGAVWLQSDSSRGAEIDFIEAFGLGYGVKHMVHYKNSAGKAVRWGDYIKSIPGVDTKAWWDDYHVFSVEWTKAGYVFRVDGVETARTTKGVSKANQYLVISMLTSDWELPRLNRDRLPLSMDVDWVRIWQQA